MKAHITGSSALLRSKMEERGWTVEDMACVLGVSQSAVSTIRCGKCVSILVAAKLGAAFPDVPAIEWMRADFPRRLASVKPRTRSRRTLRQRLAAARDLVSHLESQLANSRGIA